MPSWEFFAEAAEEEIPTYKVETARSERSRCTVCKKNSAKAAIADSAAAESSTAIVASTARSSSRAKKSSSSAMVKQTGDTTVIEKDEIRVGSIDQIAGSYGRYVWPVHITYLYLSFYLLTSILLCTFRFLFYVRAMEGGITCHVGEFLRRFNKV